MKIGAGQMLSTEGKTVCGVIATDCKVGCMIAFYRAVVCLFASSRAVNHF